MSNESPTSLIKSGFIPNRIASPCKKNSAENWGEVSGKADYQLFLVNSGAEANENALKLASFHNGRKKIVGI